MFTYQHLKQIFHLSLMLGVSNEICSAPALAQAVDTEESDRIDTLSAVTVSARRAGIDEVPPDAAGGQLGSGARMGVFGNISSLDIPFSVTSYTAQTIDNLNAQSIGQVVTSLPSVRSTAFPMAAYEILNIRGLDVPTPDFAVNGMFGLRLPMEAVERVEVLMGPSAALFGMPPGGSVGGVVNLAPKRAGDTQKMRVTMGIYPDSILGAHMDAGRRFGADGETGARINLIHRKGDAAIDGESKKYSAAALGLDSRTERFRTALDVIYISEHTTPNSRRFQLSPDLTALPFAPENSFSVPGIGWGDGLNNRSALLRIEFDLGTTLVAYAGYGKNRVNWGWLGAVPVILDPAGNYRAVTDWTLLIYDYTSQELGLRGLWHTGPIKHQAVLGWTRLRQDTHIASFRQFPIMESNMHSGRILPTPSTNGINNPLRPSSNTRLDSVVLADTLSFANDQILLTVGMRRQHVENHDFTRPPESSHYDQSANTSLFGVAYKLRGDFSLYANYVEGLSRGESAPNFSTLRNPGEQMPPYISRQMEIGGKWDTQQWITSISLFQLKKPSAGILGDTFGVFGEQRSRGIEISAVGETAHSLRILSGANWLDAIMQRSANPLLQGRWAIGVPRWGFNFGIEWDTWFLPGLTLTARLVQTGPMEVQTAHRIRVPGSQRLDAGLRYAAKVAGRSVVVRANMENLTDRNYWVASTANSLYVGSPRMVSLSATVDF